MSRLQKALIVRVGMLAVLVLTGCTASVRIDLPGLWQGTITWTNGPAAGIASPLAFDLVHEDRTLSGTVTLISHGSQTFDLPITGGRGRNFSLEIEASGTNPLVTPPAAVTLHLEGDYSASLMSGAGTQTVNGTTYQLTWEAALIWTPSEETSSD